MTAVLLVANPGHHLRTSETELTVSVDPSTSRFPKSRQTLSSIHGDPETPFYYFLLDCLFQV